MLFTFRTLITRSGRASHFQQEGPLLRLRKPMTPTLYLSISLALADTFTSLNLAAGLIVNSLLFCVFNIDITPGGGKCFKLAVEVSRLGAISSTVVHLLALGINHWIGIIRPLHYAAIMTRRAAWVVILLSWFCPMFLIFLYFSIPHRGFLSEKCETTEFLEEFPWRAVYVSSFFVPLLVMSLIYLHIYVIVKKHNQYRLRYQSSQQLQRNVKAVITTVLILGTYIIGWMPAILWYILVCKTCTFRLDQIEKEVAVPVNFVINTLIILKALVNPIIYAARMSDIKTALNKMRYEFLSRCFGNYFHEEPPQDPMERGSLCESRSLRVSSRGSSTGGSRRVAGTTNSLNSTMRSHRTTNNHNFQGNTNGNRNNNQDTLEMMEWK
ncbi:unnamed protein product [Allacma fusca]|uniref:G-protein coupled receptors family 1 profile domain-containing protein n=1 Tax=Allacma fusca TaxID=39272 RepID=A0A8J2LVD3_9HEXA|nr:unnamed protein product [Allacma fusca]